MRSLLTELVLDDALEGVSKYASEEARDSRGRWSISADGIQSSIANVASKTADQVKRYYRVRYVGAKNSKEHVIAAKFHRRMEQAFGAAALASRLVQPVATIPLTIAAGLHKLAADTHERKSHV